MHSSFLLVCSDIAAAAVLAAVEAAHRLYYPKARNASPVTPFAPISCWTLPEWELCLLDCFLACMISVCSPTLDYSGHVAL